MKFQKIQDKDNFLKATRGDITYKGKGIKLASDFLSPSLDCKETVWHYFQNVKRKISKKRKKTTLSAAKNVVH